MNLFRAFYANWRNSSEVHFKLGLCYKTLFKNYIGYLVIEDIFLSIAKITFDVLRKPI